MCICVSGIKIGLLTPKGKSRSLVTPVPSVQTINSDRLISLYSKSPTAPGSSHLNDLCKSVFVNNQTVPSFSSPNKSRKELCDSSNNAALTGFLDCVRKPIGNTTFNQLKHKSHLPSAVAPEQLEVLETFDVQITSPLNSKTSLPEKPECERSNSVFRRRHTSSTCSSNSTEGVTHGQSRCSLCDGCSSNASSSYSTSALLGIENDVHSMAEWETKDQDSTRYLLAQMQEDVAVLFDSMASHGDQQLHTTFTEPKTAKEVIKHLMSIQSYWINMCNNANMFGFNFIVE